VEIGRSKGENSKCCRSLVSAKNERDKSDLTHKPVSTKYSNKRRLVKVILKGFLGYRIKDDGLQIKRRNASKRTSIEKVSG